jgi:hypothetical protein
MGEMTVSAQHKATSTGTKLMTATIAVLGVVLIVLTAMLWSQARHRSGIDHIETAAVVSPARMATYTLSLAEFVKERCGETPTAALAAASEAENRSDPAAYREAVSEAAARARTITTTKSCDYVISEIQAAEQRAGGSQH